ncbi:MAG: hypothetical protein WKG07_25640 [Hymenobacter sp.]
MTLTPNKAAYAPHDPVYVKVQVTDATGRPAAARLSVTVAEAGAAGLAPNGGDVASSLLLTSDLAGYVESPGYYLQTPTPESTLALDNLLLTQGWRRYVWKEVLGPTPAPALPRRAGPGAGRAGDRRGPSGPGQGPAYLHSNQAQPQRAHGRDAARRTLPVHRLSGPGYIGGDLAGAAGLGSQQRGDSARCGAAHRGRAPTPCRP